MIFMVGSFVRKQKAALPQAAHPSASIVNMRPELSNIFPFVSIHEQREMTDIRRCDYRFIAFFSHKRGLRRKNHVAVKRLIIRRRSSPIASRSPELSRFEHCGRRERDIANRIFKMIETFDALRQVCTKQLSTKFIVRNFRYSNLYSVLKQLLHPTDDGRVCTRMRHHPQRAGIQQYDSTHRRAFGRRAGSDQGPS